MFPIATRFHYALVLSALLAPVTALGALPIVKTGVPTKLELVEDYNPPSGGVYTPNGKISAWFWVDGRQFNMLLESELSKRWYQMVVDAVNRNRPVLVTYDPDVLSTGKYHCQDFGTSGACINAALFGYSIPKAMEIRP